MAGWHSAAILKGFSGVLAVKEMTLEPQQNCMNGSIKNVLVKQFLVDMYNSSSHSSRRSSVGNLHPQRPIP